MRILTGFINNSGYVFAMVISSLTGLGEGYRLFPNAINILSLTGHLPYIILEKLTLYPCLLMVISMTECSFISVLRCFMWVSCERSVF